MGELVQAGRYSPRTVNSWLAILRVIINSFVEEMELARNPVAGIKNLDTSERPAYTEEEPNSLTAEEVQRFLGAMRDRFPQHFTIVALGFATGLRPSSMRPLRRSGPLADVLWEKGVLLVRRSHTRRQEVMETTKTKLRQRLPLPVDLMDILHWHVERLPKGPMQTSDLLFPATTGGFRSASCLDKPFREVTKVIKLSKKITPRAMRRTFQDLARAAEVNDIVTRAISGHVTKAMQRHYSTVAPVEVLEGIGKVVSLTKAREAMARKSPGFEELGVKQGVKGAEKESVGEA